MTNSLTSAETSGSDHCSTVSVVVCSRNRPESLAACLAALARQSVPAEEVIVVDNAAPGERAVERLPEGVRWVREPRPGIPHARNRGWQTAAAELVAYIDDDCLPGSRWLASVRRAFSEPAVGAVTGPIQPVSQQSRAQRLMEQRGGFSRGERRILFRPESSDPGDRVYPLQAWRYGSGANMSFRRQALERMGGFDPLFGCGEDLEIFYRTLRSGWSLLYEPEAMVRHHHLATMPAVRQRLLLWGWAYGALLGKVMLVDAPMRTRALREFAGVLEYHTLERLLPALLRRPGAFPLHLVLLEMAGLLGGAPGFLLRSAHYARLSRQSKTDRLR